MGSGSPGLLETAAACAEEQLGAFTPGQLAKVAWSFAKLGWPAPRVLRHAGAQLAATTAAFTDKEASNVLWALASAVRAHTACGRLGWQVWLGCDLAGPRACMPARAGRHAQRPPACLHGNHPCACVSSSFARAGRAAAAGG